jgi:hypothetical protein
VGGEVVDEAEESLDVIAGVAQRRVAALAEEAAAATSYVVVINLEAAAVILHRQRERLAAASVSASAVLLAPELLVLGWRHCPATEHRAPVVATTSLRMLREP